MKRRDPGTDGWSYDLLEQEMGGVARLRFTPSLERQFRAFLHDQTVRQARIALVVSVGVFFLFGGVDHVLFPDLAGEMWRLRYLVLGPVFMVLAGVSFTGWGQKYLLELILVILWSATAGIVGFMAITSAHDPQLYYGGLLLTVVVCYIFFGLRLPEAALIGWGIVALYVAGERLLIGSDRVHLLNNTLGLAATNLLGMVGAYIMERQHRKVFLQSLMIEREKQQLEKANARLKELSYEDGLTGIANRRHFDERLQEEWVRALRHAYPLTVLMLDVDHFKAYNDSEGHQAGDECLRRIGGLLSHFAQRPGDLAARYGGEEFVLVLSGTTGGDAWEVAQRVRHEVMELRIPHPASSAAGVITVSVGVASTVPSPGESPGALVAAADRALYAAKASGRNCVFME